MTPAPPENGKNVPRSRSLIAKLVLFLLIFSIPALLLVEITVLSFEYSQLVRRLDQGAVKVQAQLLAQELFPYLEDPPEEIRLRLNNARLMLQDPRSTWIGEPFVLAELSSEPIRVTLRRADGSLWVAAAGALRLPENGARRWKGEAIVPGAAEFVRIEISLSPPWRRIQSVFSFEWPVMVACLLLVGLGAGVFLHRVVLRRLERIAAAAEGWSRERFASPLKDKSQDEIGALTRRLNQVALALRARMEERARLAGLEERERLARDLHDSVKQHGFALELQLGALAAVLPKPELGADPMQRSQAQVALEEAQQLSLQIRRELEVILGQLRAPSDSLALVQALSQRAQDFARRSGVPCAVQASGVASKLNATDQAGVLRIVDEALANIWRHSGATQASITLSEQQALFTLCIVDNGHGFELGQALLKDSMGLKNLADRARRLPSGRMNVHTGAGTQGTKVELQWQE
jgi:signal transduction histidine kinase